METQSIEEAKSMSAMAAAAAHAKLAQAQQLQQTQQQYAALPPGQLQTFPQQHTLPPNVSFPPPPPTAYSLPPTVHHQVIPASVSWDPPPSSSIPSWDPPPSSSIPPQFRCSIDGELMEDPVIALDGYSYERFILERYFRSHDVSPRTGQVLPNKSMMPNIALKEMIGEWMKEKGGGGQGYGEQTPNPPPPPNPQQQQQQQQGHAGEGPKEQARRIAKRLMGGNLGGQQKALGTAAENETNYNLTNAQKRAKQKVEEVRRGGGGQRQEKWALGTFIQHSL